MDEPKGGKPDRKELINMAQASATKKRTTSTRRKASEQLKAVSAVKFMEPTPAFIETEQGDHERIEVSSHAGEAVEVATPTPDNPSVAEIAAAKREEIKQPRMNIAPYADSNKAGIATMTPDKLKEIAFISTYSTQDPQSSSPRQHGYQREPMAARFPGIGRYYAKGENRHLITPIIASARVYTEKDQARFIKLFNDGDIRAIHDEFGNHVLSIVDGQHRLGGLYWAWQNIDNFNADVPVMVFFGLNYAEEANLFDTINTNQRRLPKALIEATKVHMEAGDKSHAQFIREVAFALAQDGDSVWKGLVNMTGARDPEKPVSYEGIRRATQNMLHERVVNRLKQREYDPEAVAKKYWEMVSRACAPAWQDQPRMVWNSEGEEVEEPIKYRIKDLVGVAALSKLGQDVIQTSLDKSKTEEEFWDNVSEMVSKLGAVDWEKRRGNPWVASSAGFAGMGDLYQMLFDLVYLDKAPGVAVEPDEA